MPLAGLHVNYHPDTQLAYAGGVNFANSCNQNCSCATYPYAPVCGSDGVVYFSSCFAGCRQLVSATGTKKQYSECICIAPDPSILTNTSNLSTFTAVDGYCDLGCSTLPVFLIALFLIMFFSFANISSYTAVLLRVLPEEQRSLGVGIQNLLHRLIGSIPAPVIFGFAIDRACALWESKCSATGSCWEYDNWNLRITLVLLALIPKSIVCLLFYLSLHYLPRVDDLPRSSVRESVTAVARRDSFQVKAQPVNAAEAEPKQETPSV